MAQNRILRFLGKHWWQGLACLVAIASLIVTVWIAAAGEKETPDNTINGPGGNIQCPVQGDRNEVECQQDYSSQHR